MFRHFKSRLALNLNGSQDPMNVKIEHILPSVCARLNNIQEKVEGGFSEIGRTQIEFNDVRRLLTHMFSAAANFQFADENQQQLSDSNNNSGKYRVFFYFIVVSYYCSLLCISFCCF